MHLDDCAGLWRGVGGNGQIEALVEDKSGHLNSVLCGSDAS